MVDHQCLHSTPSESEARWAQVDAMPYDDRPADLRMCWCCLGPAKDELCTRCTGRLL